MIVNGTWGADVRGYRGFGDVYPLKPNDRSPEVKDWQRNLAFIGFSVGLTGIFDGATQAATREFKGAMGLADNVLVDDAALEAMASEIDRRGSAPVQPLVPNQKTPDLLISAKSNPKVLIGIGIAVVLAGAVLLKMKSKSPKLAGYRKRKRRYGDNDTTKIWKLQNGRWTVERVVESDPRQQARWLQILRSDEPTLKFKISKTQPN